MEQFGVTSAQLTQQDALAVREYNFDRFRTRHLWRDVVRTVGKEGIPPGTMVPDFNLPRADGGGSLRLSELRDQPVLLHFGSLT